jgi:hypothetical protein
MSGLGTWVHIEREKDLVLRVHLDHKDPRARGQPQRRTALTASQDYRPRHRLPLRSVCISYRQTERKGERQRQRDKETDRECVYERERETERKEFSAVADERGMGALREAVPVPDFLYVTSTSMAREKTVWSAGCVCSSASVASPRSAIYLKSPIARQTESVCV